MAAWSNDEDGADVRLAHALRDAFADPMPISPTTADEIAHRGRRLRRRYRGAAVAGAVLMVTSLVVVAVFL